MPTFPLAIICIAIVAVFYILAVFKSYEMNCIQFLGNFIKLFVTGDNKNELTWQQGIDSHAPLSIGYVSRRSGSGDASGKNSKKNHERFQSVEDSLKQI